MKLKERWTKQNNSVKLLLKKLKRHDTVVVAIAVVIAMVLCGGLIYLSTPVVSATARQGLEQTENANSEKTIEKLGELQDYLEGMDQSIAESRESITSFNQKTDSNLIENEKNTEKITSTVTEKVTGLESDLKNLQEKIVATETSIAALKELIDKSGKDSDKQITERFTLLYANLEEIQKEYEKSIENTREMIRELTDTMKDGDSKLSKEFASNYQFLLNRLNETETNLSVQNSNALTSYKEELSNLSTQITNRLNQLSSEVSSGINSVNSNLNNLDDNMNKRFDDQNARMAENLGSQNDLITDGFNSQKELITNGFNAQKEQMDQGFDDQKSSMSQGFDNQKNEMNQNFSNQKTEITNGFNQQNQNITDLGTSITNQFSYSNEYAQGNMNEVKLHVTREVNGLKDRINDFFTSVSNGKKKLASALLTKGVTVRGDATFDEIAAAIRRIPVNFVVDRSDVPGQVSYVYHYHKDGTDRECDEQLVEPGRKGGCYTREVVHHHSDECQEETTYYTYWTGHGAKVLAADIRRDGEGKPVNRYYCEYCKKTYENSDPGHSEKAYSLTTVASRHGERRKDHTTVEMVCGHEDGECLGYQTGCGYVHGQVVSATIKFPADLSQYNTVKENNTAASRMLMTSFRAVRAPVMDLEAELDFETELDLEAELVPEDVEESADTGEQKENDDTKEDTSKYASDENKSENSNEEKETGSSVEKKDPLRPEAAKSKPEVETEPVVSEETEAEGESALTENTAEKISQTPESLQ